MRTFLIHKKDIKLNKAKLDAILDSQKMSYTELHDKVSKEFGLQISYKGFMNILSNRNSWKFLYAYALCELLKVNYNQIFELIDVDVDAERKERQKMKSKDIRNKGR
ncbi:transcriptional regulator [Bacillus phage vB_BanS-Thrax5]|nr:transcriptional regulator [Bacillus phage vB_BanS-Thrax5]